MLITIDDLLPAQECRTLRSRLDTADWRDGTATAGSLSRAVKQNQQLEPASALARELGARVLQALHAHPRFVSAALPRMILPPRFNRYSGGGQYGVHVDAAVMRHDDDGSLMRSDLAATLFLAEPEDYDGGELRIETGFGAQAVKLPAGALVLYPASSLHEVTPVTRGARVAAFCWIQSLVPDAAARALLFDLDQDVQRLSTQLAPDDPTLVSLAGIYHNLLRRWTR